MPDLQGKTVVVTRAEADAGPLRDRLESRGARVVLVPAVSFEAAGMLGGTRLMQHETINLKGMMKLIKPLIQRMFHRALVKRLQGIKQVLESSVANELEE